MNLFGIQVLYFFEQDVSLPEVAIQRIQIDFIAFFTPIQPLLTMSVCDWVESTPIACCMHEWQVFFLMQLVSKNFRYHYSLQLACVGNNCVPLR